MNTRWILVLALAMGGCIHTQSVEPPTQYDETTEPRDAGVPTQNKVTVTAPQWIADHYIGSTAQNHQHTGATIAALEAACLAHFPKTSNSSTITSGSQVHACRNPRYYVTATYSANTAVNCEVSPWSEWQPQQCYAPQEQTRTRTVTQPPANGGTACPPLTETRVCPNLPPEQQSWTRAGVENTTITPPGGVEHTYRFGCDDADNDEFYGCPAGDVWSPTRVFSSPFVCSNTTFGGDPIEGVEKTCQVSSVKPPPPNNSGTASLRWTAPTLNLDGSPLTNLAGFRIYYGMPEEPHRWNIGIASPTQTSYTVTNLLGGTTFHFMVRAVNTAGDESGDSNTAIKTLP